MKEILEAPWMAEMIRTATNMYDHGWDERNGATSAFCWRKRR